MKDLKIADSGQCIINEFGIKKLRNFSIGKGALMYSPNSFELSIDETYENAGIIGSGGSMSMYLKKIPQDKQAGSIMSCERFNYSYERNDLPKNHKDAPSMTSDPQMKSYLMAHENDAKKPEFFQSKEFLRRQDDFYKRKGYKPKVDDKTMDALGNIGNTFAKSKKITVYIDHYLNTITYHYTTYQPSGNTVLTGVSETGYMFQNREKLEQEIEGNIPPQLDNFLGKLKDILDTTKKLSDKQLKDTEERNRKEEARKLDALMNVPSIKSAYKDLEVTNKKLIETADKLSNLDTFLNNTMELTNLKKEYNTIARECLIQLTKFRISVQTFASEHPEYAKIADSILQNAEAGGLIVAGLGIVTTIWGTACVSVPITLAGVAIATVKSNTFNFFLEYYKEDVLRWAQSQGKNLKEQWKFEETANWVIDILKIGHDIKSISKAVKNYKETFSPKLAKLHIPIIDKSVELASLLNNASKNYYKSNKSRLVEDVLRIFTNG